MPFEMSLDAISPKLKIIDDKQTDYCHSRFLFYALGSKGPALSSFQVNAPRPESHDWRWLVVAPEQ